MLVGRLAALAVLAPRWTSPGKDPPPGAGGPLRIDGAASGVRIPPLAPALRRLEDRVLLSSAAASSALTCCRDCERALAAEAHGASVELNLVTLPGQR